MFVLNSEFQCQPSVRQFNTQLVPFYICSVAVTGGCSGGYGAILCQPSQASSVAILFSSSLLPLLFSRLIIMKALAKQPSSSDSDLKLLESELLSVKYSNFELLLRLTSLSKFLHLATCASSCFWQRLILCQCVPWCSIKRSNFFSRSVNGAILWSCRCWRVIFKI